MQTRLEKMADITILVISGENLDHSTANELKENMVSVLKPNQKIIFDMSQLQFVDSSGLGVLLSCLRKLHAVGGELKISGLTEKVSALFDLVRMHRIFDIYNTREEACGAFLN